jgi:hypothetical protein
MRIQHRLKPIFMSIGGPQAHGNSKPLNERNRLFATFLIA